MPGFAVTGSYMISFIEQELDTSSAELLVYDLSTHSSKKVKVSSAGIVNLNAIKANSAFYDSATEAYILGYKELTSSRETYLFKFDFASPTAGELKRYPISMF